MKTFFVCMLALCLNAWAEMPKSKLAVAEPEEGIFSGRIAKVNELASLVRIRVEFDNMRYLNKKDRVDFWDVHNPSMRCKSYIAGKSNDYILVKIPDYKFCQKFLFISIGAYIQMYSQDLVNNLKMGKELVAILLKRRLAIHGRLTEKKKELDSHIEKVNAVNARYTVLREKLEAEWRDEIGHLEEDKITSLRNYKDLEIQLNEIIHKLEKYKISDKNLEVDRWALDSRLFFKK